MKARHYGPHAGILQRRAQPRCNEDEAFIETTVLMMSMEAYRQKRTVRWDAVKEEIV